MSIASYCLYARYETGRVQYASLWIESVAACGTAYVNSLLYIVKYAHLILLSETATP